MSKNYFLYASLALIVIVLGTLGWYFLSKRPQVLAEFALPAEVTVTLRDSGFDPAELTIEKGTAVRFINATTSPQASINSDDYPTNKLYPELNLGKFTPNSSLSHIFKNSGTYSYHDQFHPERKGTIEVK